MPCLQIKVRLETINTLLWKLTSGVLLSVQWASNQLLIHFPVTLQVESLFVIRQSLWARLPTALWDLGPVQLMPLPAVTPGSSSCKHLCSFFNCVNRLYRGHCWHLFPDSHFFKQRCQDQHCPTILWLLKQSYAPHSLQIAPHMGLLLLG